MLVGEYVRLRVADLSDSEFIRRLRNAPHVVREFQYRHFLSDLQQQKFIESLAGDATKIVFVAEEIETGRPFGVYYFTHIDHRNQRANAGIFTDLDKAGNAAQVYEGLFLFYDYAFGYLNLHKLTAEVLPENHRGIRMNESVGMQREGVLQDHAFFDGGFHDVACYALFRDDFYERPTRSMAHFQKRRQSNQSD